MTALRIQNVTKRYGPSVVLDDVSLRLESGKVRALVGETGAGKSTLIRVACGLAAQEAGSVSIDGETVPPGSARRAAQLGIGVVHQHFMLIDPMTVAENVVLGAREPRSGPFRLRLDRVAARERVRNLGDRYGLAVDPEARVEKLSVGERQRVELLKVLHRGAKFLLLDEPTAVLSPHEIQGLLDIVPRAGRRGCGGSLRVPQAQRSAFRRRRHHRAASREGHARAIEGRHDRGGRSTGRGWLRGLVAGSTRGD